jgi:hypothetical protein
MAAPAAAAAAAAAAPPAPADALAALRARTSLLGAPLDVSDACLGKYVLFGEGRDPMFVIQDGIFLEKAPTIEEAYVPYFKPVWDKTAGRLKLKCVCCKTGPISYHVVGPKHTFPFSNALEHLKRCPGLPPLLPEHIADRKSAKQESPEPQHEKRPRILGRGGGRLRERGGEGGYCVGGCGAGSVGGQKKSSLFTFWRCRAAPKSCPLFHFHCVTRGALEMGAS